MNQGQESLPDAMLRVEDGVRLMYEGSSEPFSELWSPFSKTTLFGAFGAGCRGWQQLAPVLPTVAQRYRDGTVDIDYMAVFEAADLAVIVGYERAVVSIDGDDAAPSTIRFTHVLRREGDRWALVHRHGDFEDPIETRQRRRQDRPTNLRDHLFSALNDLRFEPTPKRIRATFGDRTVVDSRRAMLVWEPKRIVPSYAVPHEDITAELIETDPASVAQRADAALAGHAVLTPEHPFTMHVSAGTPVAIRADGRCADGYRLPAPNLASYIVLDFAGFDRWYEEDDPNVAHPRDPYHRIDILHSSRHVIVEHHGTVIADSHTPYLLFEPPLPVRYYLPADDVATDLLIPSETRTSCAYKGHATHWSLGTATDIGWSYDEPLRDAHEVAGRFAFYNERLDITVDGEPPDHPVTPWTDAVQRVRSTAI